MAGRSLLRPSIGVNIEELAGKIAQDMQRAGDAAYRAKLERGHEYERREEYYCIARRKLTGAYELETVEPVLRFGRMRSGGPSLEACQAEMAFGFAGLLHRSKIEPSWEAASDRAAKCTFYVAEVLGEP